MVISKQLVKEVDGFGADEPLVLGVDERGPWLLRVPREDLVILRIKLDVVLVQVLEQLLRSKNLGDLDQLIRVAVPVEERFLAEDHRGEHGTQRPHVQGVVVFLVVNEELGALEVSGSDPDVVLRALVVEFRQTPVDQSKLQRSGQHSLGSHTNTCIAHRIGSPSAFHGQS